MNKFSLIILMLASSTGLAQASQLPEPLLKLDQHVAGVRNPVTSVCSIFNDKVVIQTLNKPGASDPATTSIAFTSEVKNSNAIVKLLTTANKTAPVLARTVPRPGDKVSTYTGNLLQGTGPLPVSLLTLSGPAGLKILENRSKAAVLLVKFIQNNCEQKESSVSVQTGVIANPLLQSESSSGSALNAPTLRCQIYSDKIIKLTILNGQSKDAVITKVAYTNDIRDSDTIVTLIQAASEKQSTPTGKLPTPGSRSVDYVGIKTVAADAPVYIPLLSRSGDDVISVNKSKAATRLIQFIKSNCEEQ